MIELPQKNWVQNLFNRSPTRTFKAGDSIVLQGEPSEFVGYILSGRARAISYSETGSTTWVGYFESEEFFGQISLLTQSPVNFEIMAETDVTAIIIKTNVIHELMVQENKLNIVLIESLASRLNLMTQRLVEAFTLSAKGRICAELERLSCVMGITPEKKIIRPNPVFVDLALRVNSSRETVSRTVSELQKKGIVSREPGALIIENPDRLMAAIQ